MGKKAQGNKWNAIWAHSDATGLWSRPDPDLEALIPQLKEEGVSRVLDLGCGIGHHTVLLAAAGFETYAMDSSEQGIERCRAWIEAEGLEAATSVAPMGTLDFPDGFFDFVVSWNVVYHAMRADMVTTLAAIRRITRDGGLFYVTFNSTRNHKYGAGTEIEPGTFDDPGRGHGHHLHHYSDEADVRDLLRDWHIEWIKESEEWLGGRVHPGTWHWMVLARKT